MSCVIWPNPPGACKKCGQPHANAPGFCPADKPKPASSARQHIVVQPEEVLAVSAHAIKNSRITAALLVMLKTEQIRLWLRLHDNKALEQAISAVEAEVPGALGELTDQVIQDWLEEF